MPVHVNFQTGGGLGSIHVVGVGLVRAHETVAAAATGSLTAADGEIAILVNTETDPVYVAHGSTPSAAATTATTATTARYPVPPNVPFPVQVRTGDKFAVAAIA